MTIKEIEELTGMTRANIRFYENQGLIDPKRSENGYREYSQDDLEILKKIKLLRTLHISLEEIKLLHTGQQNLLTSLNIHSRQLVTEKADLETSQRICDQMQEDRVSYESLNAQYYLERIGQESHEPVPELQADKVPRVRAPWRRYFARMFDLMLYTNIWYLVLEYGFHVKVQNLGVGVSWLHGMLAFAIMFLVEPVLLHFCGTTPGKWLLGMRITDIDDQKLRLDDAQIRTWNVMLHGMGLELPFYSLYRNWKSYWECTDGKELPWDEVSVISVKDENRWRIGAFVGVYLVVVGFFSIASYMAGVPGNKGNLTIAEFAENYNQMAEYHELAGAGSINHGKLDREGKWQGAPAGTVMIGGTYVEPEIQFAVEDGYVKEVGFSYFMKNEKGYPKDYCEKMIVCAMAFVWARDEFPIFSKEMKELADYINTHSFEDFSISKYGVNIVCDVEYSGYNEYWLEAMNRLVPEENEHGDYKNEYHFEFRMKLDD